MSHPSEAVIKQRDHAHPSTLERTVGIALFVALTAAAARIRVPLPFTPVPMTMQPMAVLLAGAILGPRAGALSQILYISIGLAGVPVFAGAPGAGPAVLLGPTGGYLVSYPLVALLVGALAGRSAGFIRMALAMILGLAVIYASGTLQLMAVTSSSFDQALAGGIYPFLMADLIKVGVAALLAAGYRAARPRLSCQSKR